MVTDDATRPYGLNPFTFKKNYKRHSFYNTHPAYLIIDIVSFKWYIEMIPHKTISPFLISSTRCHQKTACQQFVISWGGNGKVRPYAFPNKRNRKGMSSTWLKQITSPVLTCLLYLICYLTCTAFIWLILLTLSSLCPLGSHTYSRLPKLNPIHPDQWTSSASHRLLFIPWHHNFQFQVAFVGDEQVPLSFCDTFRSVINQRITTLMRSDSSHYSVSIVESNRHKSNSLLQACPI